MSLRKRTRRSAGIENANNEFRCITTLPQSSAPKRRKLEEKPVVARSNSRRKSLVDNKASNSNKSPLKGRKNKLIQRKIVPKSEPKAKIVKQEVGFDEPAKNSTTKVETEDTWSEHELLASIEQISVERAQSIIQLFREDNTVPFLCRYRRHLIGWDTTPEKLQSIKSAYKEVTEIKTKAQSVIKTLEKKGQLSPEIKTELLKAKTLDTINHLYDPFKERKTTLYQRAVELGLLVPADRFLNAKAPLCEFNRYVNEDVEGLESLAKVREGVKNIISHKISKHIAVLEHMELL